MGEADGDLRAGTPYALDVQESLWRSGIALTAAVANARSTPQWTASRAPSPWTQWTRPGIALPVLLPTLTPGHRRALEEEARAAGFGALGTLVDPTAVVARSTPLGDGCYVNAGAGRRRGGRVGRLVSINRSASVGHHARIADYATLGPGCVLAGSCTIGRGAFVGAGARWRPGPRWARTRSWGRAPWW